MGNWRISFRDETTESKQRLQKSPRFILEKLDDIGFIGFEEAIQNPGAQKKKLSTLFRRGHAV